MTLWKQVVGRRWDLVCCSVLLLFWLAIWAPRHRGPINLRWDAGVYYILGMSLAEGKGYRLLNEPGEIEVTQYPPLLPLLVASYIRANRTADPIIVGERLRGLYFIMSGAYLFAAYALVRAAHRPCVSLLIVMITGLSSCGFLYLSDSLYAEIPFALVSTLFLLSHRLGDRPGALALTSLLGGAAFLLRTAGIALLLAWVVESLSRSRWRQATVRAVIAIIPVILWQAHIANVKSREAGRPPVYPYQTADYYYSNVTYSRNAMLSDPFDPAKGRIGIVGVMLRTARNTATLPLALGEGAWTEATTGPFLVERLGLVPALSKVFNWGVLSTLCMQLFLTLTGCAILLGAVLLGLGRERLWGVYFGLSVLLIMLTPWPSQYCRYLAVLSPLSLAFLASGIEACGQRFVRSNDDSETGILSGGVRFILVTMALAQAAVVWEPLRTLPPVTFYSVVGKELNYGLLWYDSAHHDLDRAYEYIRRHAGPSDITATSMPHLAFLRTGRKAVLPPFESDPVRASSLLDAVPASFLVLDEIRGPPISRRFAEPVAIQSDKWRLVFSTAGKGTRVYQRMH